MIKCFRYIHLQSSASSGDATFTASTNNYPTVTGNVTLLDRRCSSWRTTTTPSLPCLSPEARCCSRPTSTQWIPNTGHLGDPELLAGGQSLPLSISDNPNVGTITQPTITGGSFGANPIFTPLVQGIGGSTQVVLQTPANFTNLFNTINVQVGQ